FSVLKMHTTSTIIQKTAGDYSMKMPTILPVWAIIYVALDFYGLTMAEAMFISSFAMMIMMIIIDLRYNSKSVVKEWWRFAPILGLVLASLSQVAGAAPWVGVAVVVIGFAIHYAKHNRAGDGIQ